MSHQKSPASQRKKWVPEVLLPFGVSKGLLVHLTCFGQRSLSHSSWRTKIINGFELSNQKHAEEDESFLKQKCTCSLSITILNKENEKKICTYELWKLFMPTVLCFIVLLWKIQLNKEKSVTGSLASFRKCLEWVRVFPSVCSSKNTVLQVYGIV